MVFLTRYIDLLFGWKTLYVFVMKIVFISFTGYTIYLMKFKKPYSLSLDRDADALPHYYLYAAALLAAILVHKSLNPLDFLWSFSIWLEALAILPQLYMINKLRDIENITAHYVLFLGLYRGFYILHWYACTDAGYSGGKTWSGPPSSQASYRRSSMPTSCTTSSRPTSRTSSSCSPYDTTVTILLSPSSASHTTARSVLLLIEQGWTINLIIMNNLGRRGPVSGAGRRVSPNSYLQRNNNSNMSVHSEHLWNMM